ncbi:efflux RND transporter periplasmic adaptor subunit [Acidobacteria bacterium AH-259-G07]|nr:efflux RND transporter periplasmic adaptor subunit [Acidobacteria bacterium AH-259-G07]
MSFSTMVEQPQKQAPGEHWVGNCCSCSRIKDQVGIKSKILISVAVLVILSAIVGYSINVHRAQVVSVQTAIVERKNRLVSKASASGEIKPKEYVELQAEIAGVITDLHVKEGDRVEKGYLLLRIDPTQSEAETRAQQALLEVALAEAASQKAQITLQKSNLDRDRANIRVMEAEFLGAQKTLGIAQNAFDRKQQLYEDNLISREVYEAAKNDLVRAETALASAEARLDQAKAQLAVSEVILEQVRNAYKSALSRVEQNRALLARNQDLLSKTVIRSPLSGVITKLNVEVGERAVPGTLNNPAATLMEIADLSTIEAEIEVDETDIVNVKLGQEAQVKVDALPDTPIKGSVTEIGNSAINTAGRQQEAKDFKVVIQLDDPPATLRPGLSCTAEITTAIREDVLAIPIQALAIREFEVDEKGNIVKLEGSEAANKKDVHQDKKEAKKREPEEFQGVFVVNEGKAEFIEVKTGITGDTEIEVLSGLKEGNEIITGSYKALRTLKERDAVKIENEANR